MYNHSCYWDPLYSPMNSDAIPGHLEPLGGTEEKAAVSCKLPHPLPCLCQLLVVNHGLKMNTTALSWRLCTRDVKLDNGCRFLSSVASLKLLFFCSKQRCTKALHRILVIKANHTIAGWRALCHPVKTLLKISKLVLFLYHGKTKTFMIREEKIQGPFICHLPKNKQVISNNKISNSIND